MGCLNISKIELNYKICVIINFRIKCYNFFFKKIVRDLNLKSIIYSKRKSIFFFFFCQVVG